MTAEGLDAIRDIALGVLRAEAEALQQAGERLGRGFDDAVELVYRSPAVIVTGLGKSGLIGAKLAATLASTGTPAHFVHAAEAAHGDAGRLAPGNVMIALSYSGSTVEVCEFARIARDRGNPVIAITGAVGSPLAQMADAAIDVNVDREADPNGLAPTTSTTVMLGVGDALALVVMVKRGVTAKDFFDNHQGGSLGEALRERL